MSLPLPQPVLYLFKLKAAAITALSPVDAVQEMKARSCGVSSGLLASAVASGAFNNRQLERLALLLRKNGQTDRTLLFLQTSP